MNVVLLQDAMEFLEKHDSELFTFINQNYSPFPLKLKKLWFDKKGFLLRKQVPLYLMLNDDAHVPYNRVRVGFNLKSIRELKGLTQLDLADESGVSERTIRYIESGKYCHFHTLRSLAEGLQVDVLRLLW